MPTKPLEPTTTMEDCLAGLNDPLNSDADRQYWVSAMMLIKQSETIMVLQQLSNLVTTAMIHSGMIRPTNGNGLIQQAGPANMPLPPGLLKRQ